MSDLISRQDAINEIKNVFDDVLCCNVSVRKGLPEAVRRIEMMPSAEPKTGEWIDKAISIIDDMRGEGIVDYEQAREFRMRARMKGANDGKMA